MEPDVATRRSYSVYGDAQCAWPGPGLGPPPPRHAASSLSRPCLCSPHMRPQHHGPTMRSPSLRNGVGGTSHWGGAAREGSAQVGCQRHLVTPPCLQIGLTTCHHACAIMAACHGSAGLCAGPARCRQVRCGTCRVRDMHRTAVASPVAPHTLNPLPHVCCMQEGAAGRNGTGSHREGQRRTQEQVCCLRCRPRACALLLLRR